MRFEITPRTSEEDFTNMLNYMEKELRDGDRQIEFINSTLSVGQLDRIKRIIKPYHAQNPVELVMDDRCRFENNLTIKQAINYLIPAPNQSQMYDDVIRMIQSHQHLQGKWLTELNAYFALKKADIQTSCEGMILVVIKAFNEQLKKFVGFGLIYNDQDFIKFLNAPGKDKDQQYSRELCTLLQTIYKDYDEVIPTQYDHTSLKKLVAGFHPDEHEIKIAVKSKSGLTKNMSNQSQIGAPLPSMFSSAAPAPQMHASTQPNLLARKIAMEHYINQSINIQNKINKWVTKNKLNLLFIEPNSLDKLTEALMTLWKKSIKNEINSLLQDGKTNPELSIEDKSAIQDIVEDIKGDMKDLIQLVSDAIAIRQALPANLKAIGEELESKLITIISSSGGDFVTSARGVVSMLQQINQDQNVHAVLGTKIDRAVLKYETMLNAAHLEDAKHDTKQDRKVEGVSNRVRPGK